MADSHLVEEAQSSLAVPNAKVRRQRISPVWFIPFFALVIAVALGVRAWQQKGEQIVITFEAAGGIEVGKTEVRLKDVPVGKVTHLQLSEDLSKVHATVTLDRSMSRHLSKNSRFWLVTPRISASGISNLGTLVSGVYIVMDPGKKEGYSDRFIGLSEPPAVQSDEKGTQYILRAQTLGSLDIGSPVYFRQLRVGEVVNYQLSEDGSHVDTRIFIEAPHDALVSARSRFWNVSGVDVSVGIDGVKAELASLSSLLLGGVAFETPVLASQQKLAEADHIFALYDNHDDATEGRFTLSYPYVLKFSHSVKGLQVGAPVEFRGLKVGRVVDVQLVSLGSPSESLEVYISLEPQRFDPTTAPTHEQLNELLNPLIKEGLRAQIKSGNLLLGSRFIELRYASDDTKVKAPITGLMTHSGVPQIPTIDEPLDKLERQLANVASAVSRFPVESIGQEMNQSLRALSNILNVFDQKKTAQALHGTIANTQKATAKMEGAVADARVTLQQLTQTLKSVDHTIAPDSQLHAEFLETLQSVSEASDSFDRFVEELYRYPSSLVFGLGKDE
ncbi:intermembrane transport protein PqiB [Marinagarivorans algicola]|uniref:PqiB family protein n=1 Tax=Marinagarivorans algicola TaxID=1513270 RepID=UPI0006B9D947|nr:MlaD family protein [Marinagarivorans algicola]